MIIDIYYYQWLLSMIFMDGVRFIIMMPTNILNINVRHCCCLYFCRGLDDVWWGLMINLRHGYSFEFLFQQHIMDHVINNNIKIVENKMNRSCYNDCWKWLLLNAMDIFNINHIMDHSYSSYCYCGTYLILWMISFKGHPELTCGKWRPTILSLWYFVT